MILWALCIAKTIMSVHPFQPHHKTSKRAVLNLYGEQSLVVLLFCSGCRRHPILKSIFLNSTIRLIAQISSWPRVDMIITAINQEKVYSHNLIECQNLMSPVLKLVSKPVELLSAAYCGNTILQAAAAYLVLVLFAKPCNGNERYK